MCDASTGGRTLPEARGQATTPPSSRGSPATILRNPGKPLLDPTPSGRMWSSLNGQLCT